eukprot:6900351-Prymnesium_polylepis.1
MLERASLRCTILLVLLCGVLVLACSARAAVQQTSLISQAPVAAAPLQHPPPPPPPPAPHAAAGSGRSSSDAASARSALARAPTAPNRHGPDGLEALHVAIAADAPHFPGLVGAIDDLRRQAFPMGTT